MMFADTNVLLDYCGLSPERAERARAFSALAEANGEPFVVTECVLAELFWVLGRSPSVPKARVVDIVMSLLSSEEFVAWDEGMAGYAIDLKRRVPKLDIEDCILAARAIVDDDVIVTNDRLLDRTIRTELER